MATVATTPATTRTPPIIDEGHLVLEGVRWETYEALLEDLDGTGLRLNYDRGVLEITAPENIHEYDKRLIGRMVEALTEVLGIAIRSGGNATFRRKLKEKGLEPDECYWVADEARVRGRRNIDLDVEPPDLAIEAENTTTILDRLSIYAGLGFPEVWRYNGETLRVLHLQADGSYVEKPGSLSFPFLPVAEVTRFLKDAEGLDETTWIRGFRAWVREAIGPGFGGAGDAGDGPRG